MSNIDDRTPIDLQAILAAIKSGRLKKEVHLGHIENEQQASTYKVFDATEQPYRNKRVFSPNSWVAIITSQISFQAYLYEGHDQIDSIIGPVLSPPQIQQLHNLLHKKGFSHWVRRPSLDYELWAAYRKVPDAEVMP